MCIRRETREKARQSLAFPPVSKPHTHITYMLRQCTSIVYLLTIKKKFMNTGVLDFFNKKLILDYYFCLKSGSVFLFQIFIIAPLSLPRDIKLYH